MFCTQCGTRALEGARFCGHCGRALGAPAAAAPSAPPPPAFAPPPPRAPAAAPWSAPAPQADAGERVIVLLRTTTARPPGARPWHRDALITDRRVVVWKAGMGSILGKSLAAGAAAGLGAGLAGASGAAVGAVLASARTPGVGDDRRLATAEVDAIVAGRPDAFTAWYAQCSGFRLVTGGFLGDPKLLVDTPQGPLEVWVGAWFKELAAILPGVLGPRLVIA